MHDADDQHNTPSPDTAAVLDQGERLLADSAQLLRRLDTLIERSRHRAEPTADSDDDRSATPT